MNSTQYSTKYTNEQGHLKSMEAPRQNLCTPKSSKAFLIIYEEVATINCSKLLSKVEQDGMKAR
jgi:hypothetical protein